MAELMASSQVLGVLVNNNHIGRAAVLRYKGAMAITGEQFNEILRLRLLQGWSIRRIARRLHMGRDTVAKTLAGKSAAPVRQKRSSKLDPFKPLIADLLETDSEASGAVILQRLQAKGYSGGKSILGDWLHKQRPPAGSKRAYVRVEVLPGERFEVDWGHFGSLDYGQDKRQLYGFCLIEAHSRRLYVEFTHSQSFETFARCHQHGFRYMGGVAREIAYDNLATAVIEHDGNLVRFNHRFLGLARDYHFMPRACHVRAPWEKGKVERAGVGYVKQNFWPLRSFSGLADLNSQARQWLGEIANQRLHRETREKPEERFRPDALRPLPPSDGDYRDGRPALVHKDLRLMFDANRYCAPARYVGHRLTVKADSYSVTLYDGINEVVAYPRCYAKSQTLGAERCQALWARLSGLGHRASRAVASLRFQLYSQHPPAATVPQEARAATKAQGAETQRARAGSCLAARIRRTYLRKWE